MTKRFAAALLTVVGTALALIGFASASGAAPYVTNPTARVSTTTPTEGGTVQVCGTGFAANSSLTMTLDTGDELGTTTADADGAYCATVTLPSGVTGTHAITVSDAAGNTATVTVTIEAAAPSSGGGVSNTGVAVMSIGGVGLLLLIGGAALVLAGRRRRATV